MHAAPTSFQYQFLRTLFFVLTMTLLFTACAEGEKQTGTSSTESQESKKASNNGGTVYTGSVPSDVKAAIDQVTS